MKRIKTVSRVVAAGGIVTEREITGGRIIMPGCVTLKCVRTGGRVAAAGGVG